MEKKYWKSQGILSSRKSGNPGYGKKQILVKMDKSELFCNLMYVKEEVGTLFL